MRASRRHVAEANARATTPTAVPLGWYAGSLGDVIRLQPGYAFKSQWFAENGVRLLRGINIEPGRTRWQDVVCLPTNRAKEFASYELKAGDVVIAMDRPLISTGLKVAALQEQDVPSLLLQRVGRFHCGETLERALLLQYLRSHLFIQHVDSQATGTQLPHISGTDIETAPFLLPPLNEQRRIVAKLDALQARSRRAREALDAVPPLLEKLRQSILAAAFAGTLTADWRAKHKDVEPASELLKRIRTERRKKWEEAELAKMKAKGKPPADDKWKAKYKEPEPVDATGLPELPEGWCWGSLDELCPGDAPAVYGIILPGDDVPTGVPYVRPVDMRDDGTVDFESLKRTTAEIASQFARASLRTGDVVLSIVGTIGKVVVVPPELDGANITQSSARIRPPPGMAPAYMGLALRSPWLTRQFDKFRFGNAVQRLNVEHVRRLGIPLAPLVEQALIVQHSETALGALPGQLLATLEERLRVLDRSILAKAFRGELVPQDPNDEPADVMLARVRGAGAAESDTPPSKTSTPRGKARRGSRKVDAHG